MTKLLNDLDLDLDASVKTERTIGGLVLKDLEQQGHVYGQFYTWEVGEKVDVMNLEKRGFLH